MNSAATILPSDELIYERSKFWADFMTRMVNNENMKSLRFEDIPSPSDTDDDHSDFESDENTPLNNCRALVRTNHFEGESSSDEFDVNDLMSETLPIIEERKRRWKESGMDKVLDTFDINAITNKVGSWLKNSKLENTLYSNSSYESAHIMHFEDHQVQLNSDDSLQSTDTAKYILSNRKQKSSRCTTMTIKSFRSVKRKQKQLQDRHNFLGLHKDFDTIFKKKCACSNLKDNIVPIANYNAVRGSNLLTPVTENTHAVDSPRQTKDHKESLNQKRSSRRRKRSSLILKQRSTSRSSSSCSTPMRNRIRAKPKLRKVPRDLNQAVTLIISSSDDNSLSAERVPTSKKPVINHKLQSESNQSNPINATINNPLESELTCFSPDNIVNSTAHITPEKNIRPQAKNCRLSPITNKVTRRSKNVTRLRKLPTENTNLEKPSTTDIDNSFRRIVIYTPKENALHSTNVVNGTFILTQDQLRKSIGNKAARRFITFNANKFPFKFNALSTVYFKKPIKKEKTHLNTSSDSEEEDVLEIFGKQGELVEELL